MILDEIVEKRKIQLEREKQILPFDMIKKQAEKISVPCRSFYSALKKDRLSVIAEVKKASPSKSVIREDFHPEEIAAEYEKSGANAISCLTEEHYFQGSSKYLTAIRKNAKIPVLRKDFIFDEYQLYEARVIGADAVLLIGAILDTDTLKRFSGIAHNLGMDCLFEVHNEEELESVLKCSPKIVGINNRNLKTFEVSLENTKKLAGQIPSSCAVVSESGIASNSDMKIVRKNGADAVLIGETLMRSENITETINALRDGV